MKVVSVLTSGTRGGAEFAVKELLDAIAERGHEAVLLTDIAVVQEGRVSVRSIELGPKLSRTTYRRLFLRFPSLAWRLRVALRRERPYDVLFLHFKKEQLLTLLLPRALRPTCAWAEWGPLPQEFRAGAANVLYRLAARRADVVLAISNGTRDSLVAAGLPPAKVVVLPNAVRVEDIRFDAAGRARVRFDLGVPADAFVVGCVSRFHPKKRNDVVLDAVKLLDDSVHVVLAGSGETEPELRERARQLADRAHFLPTPTSDVASVYSAFDVSVFCPSPTEGAPRAVILAMLTERPVIATGKEGVTDLIAPGTGVILEPENDAVALSSALRAYAASPELRTRHGLEGRRLAEAVHGSGVVAAQLEAFLRSATEPSEARPHVSV
jgi:glycosyltransferase involved in cell wall biosynthesis